MTDIHGVQPPVGPKPIEQTHSVAAGDMKVEPPQISDVVEISELAKLAARINEIPDVRTDLVQRVRQELAAGTYETREKIDIAVERLMDEFFT
jgi:negative regulator of flagellin synthesis FlgM